METKQSARELLELASQEIAQAMGKLGEALGENDINEAKSVWCDMDALKTRVDAYLAAPGKDAMEILEKVRLGGYALNVNNPEDRGPNGDDYHFILSNTDAAALIEGLQRKVPRKAWEELWVSARKEGDARPIKSNRDGEIARIAAKYNVTIEED